MVLFDGQKITVYSAAHQAYAEAEIPGNLDDVLVHFRHEDRVIAEDIEHVTRMVATGELLDVAGIEGGAHA